MASAKKTSRRKSPRKPSALHSVRFHGESPRYRRARDQLLRAEIALRDQVQEVAALRQRLPLGGQVAEDYAFVEGGADLAERKTARIVRLSQLFRRGKNTLVLYNFMYGPEMSAPCPLCTSILDALNGTAPHVMQRANLAVVARSPIQRIRSFARGRDWRNLRLLSSSENTYNRDYRGEDEHADQMPALNVFVKRGGRIHHFYAAELLFVRLPPGRDPCHVDLIWPLWNILDLTPEGRGDFYPSLRY